MRKKKRWLTKRKVAGAVLLPVVCYLLGAGLLVWDGLHDELGPADAALVLGSRLSADGTPPQRLAARLDRAAALYREGLFELIIVSGGTGKEGHPVGSAMRNYLVDHGVPVQNIMVDNDGVDTAASALNAAAIVNASNRKNVLVVTQYFHVARAKLALRKAGVKEVGGAHARFFELRDIYSTLREVPAYLRYLLR